MLGGGVRVICWLINLGIWRDTESRSSCRNSHSHVLFPHQQESCRNLLAFPSGVHGLFQHGRITQGKSDGESNSEEQRLQRQSRLRGQTLACCRQAAQ